MPPHSPSELALRPKSLGLPFVFCDHFGLGVTEILPLEWSRFPPAAEPDDTAMLPGRVAHLAMHWVKKWFHLWQDFSGALMRAIVMGIAKGVCRLAAAPLEKARRPMGEKEEHARDESKVEDGEALNCEVDHQGYLILNSLESWSREDVQSLIEDRNFGERPEQFFSGAKMDKMGLEDHAALCLMHHSISFDFENDSESSSDEDVGLGAAECLGSFPQKSVEGLGIGGYFEEKGRDSRSSYEKFGDFENDLEGDSQQSVESPSVSQGHRESVEPSGDFVMFEEQSMETTSYFSKDGEYLSQNGKVKENLGTPTASYGFKSPLVFSLFYSPSQEEDDDDSEDWSSEDEMEETRQSCLDGAVLENGEYLLQYGKAKENLGTPTASYGFNSPLVLSLFQSPSQEEDDDDSEDWSSEDEMEETSQSCLDGAVLENGDSSSAAGDNSQSQGFPENLCGPCFPDVNPLHSLCFSKSIQPATFASPEPKNHKEIAVSFYIRKKDFKPEKFYNLPKPSSPKDRRSATGHPTHRCCQLETERNYDLVTTETSSDSQKACQMVKKVRFSPEVTVHTLVVWDYASRAARRGPWEEMARDRCRFQRRIAEVGAVLESCLELEHRAKAWRKIHGDVDRVPQENTDDALHGSAGQEKLCASTKIVN